ncbi:MAG: HU family DNA-binding protein [Planctomycetes bacterium]|nr:HU family DNA-binding protein [Planctomycetota bacterium]
MTRTTNQNAVQNTADTETDAFGRQANKGILADQVAEELNVPRRTATRVLDAVLDSVSDLLRGRGKVAVKGFGTFERRIRKGRAYKHPLTGESIDVANKETIIFKPSDQLIIDTRTDAPARPKKAQGSSTGDILFQG